MDAHATKDHGDGGRWTTSPAARRAGRRQCANIALDLTLPSSPSPPLPCSPSYFQRAKDAVTHALDRNDETVKQYQDMAFNFALFTAAVWAIHRFGHKLAV
jgi:hypothetical protein